MGTELRERLDAEAALFDRVAADYGRFYVEVVSEVLATAGARNRLWWSNSIIDHDPGDEDRNER